MKVAYDTADRASEFKCARIRSLSHTAEALEEPNVREFVQLFDVNPIGQSIADDEGGRLREGPLDVDFAPTEYFSIEQTRDHSFALAVRSSQDGSALLPVPVSMLHQINPNLGVFR